MSLQLENRHQYYETEERRDSQLSKDLQPGGGVLDYTDDDFEDDDDLDTVAPHNQQQQGKIKMALVIVSHDAFFRIP